MDWLSEYGLQLCLFGAYLAMLAWHAWIGTRNTGTLSDYLTAGRGLGGVVIGLSFYATYVSTNTFVGQAGKSWDVGLIWYSKAAVYGTLCYVAWYLVAPRFIRQVREFNSLTVADFLGSRYNSMAVRRSAAVLISAASVVYVVAVYKGSALGLAQFLGLSYRTAAIVIFVIVTTYTLAGGFRSVVLTDAVQGGLMLLGAVAIVVVVLIKGGGLGSMLETLRQQDPDLVSWRGKMPLATILGLALAGGLKFMVEPRQLSRFYGLKDDRATRVAAIIAPLLILVTYLALLPIGALAHALIPVDAIADSDQVIPYLLGPAKLFGPVISSLFLLVLVSAAMSSLDSVLLVAASSVVHDLLAPGADVDDGRAIWHTRVCVAVLSLTGLLLALNPLGDIVEITAFAGSLYGACFLPTIVLGLFWNRGTAIGALTCILCGAVVVTGAFVFNRLEWTHLHEIYPGLLAGTLTYVAFSLITEPNRDSS